MINVSGRNRKVRYGKRGAPYIIRNGKKVYLSTLGYGRLEFGVPQRLRDSALARVVNRVTSKYSKEQRAENKRYRNQLKQEKAEKKARKERRNELIRIVRAKKKHSEYDMMEASIKELEKWANESGFGRLF